MTHTELSNLPEILRPTQVHELTGLADEGLAALRRDHPEIVVRKCGRGRQGQWLYSKQNLLKLLKLPGKSAAPEPTQLCK